MRYSCEACQDTGWVNVAPFTFNRCDCAAGQRLRGFTNVVEIQGRCNSLEDSPEIAAAMAWYTRKLGIDPTG